MPTTLINHASSDLSVFNFRPTQKMCAMSNCIKLICWSWFNQMIAIFNYLPYKVQIS